MARLAILAALAVATGGCLSDAPATSPSPSPTAAPEATPVVTTYFLNTRVWYAGLGLKLGTATATLDEKGGRVVVDVTYDNPGADEAGLEGPIRLTEGGRGIDVTRETERPTIPAGGSVRGLVTFEVDGAFDVPGSAIRIGRSEEHQAVVPLVAGTIAPVTLKPVIVDVEADGQAGTLFVELRGIELRADLPDWRQELDNGLMAVTLTYHATFRSDFPGGFAFTADSVGLKLPDGTTVAPRRDGHSQSTLILEPRKRQASLQSRFEVPAPGPGSYALIIRDGTAKTAIPFVIPAP